MDASKAIGHRPPLGAKRGGEPRAANFNWPNDCGPHY
jgi:hypothetical protein